MPADEAPPPTASAEANRDAVALSTATTMYVGAGRQYPASAGVRHGQHLQALRDVLNAGGVGGLGAAGLGDHVDGVAGDDGAALGVGLGHRDTHRPEPPAGGCRVDDLASGDRVAGMDRDRRHPSLAQAAGRKQPESNRVPAPRRKNSRTGPRHSCSVPRSVDSVLSTGQGPIRSVAQQAAVPPGHDRPSHVDNRSSTIPGRFGGPNCRRHPQTPQVIQPRAVDTSLSTLEVAEQTCACRDPDRPRPAHRHNGPPNHRCQPRP